MLQGRGRERVVVDGRDLRLRWRWRKGKPMSQQLTAIAVTDGYRGILPLTRQPKAIGLQPECRVDLVS